MLSQELLVHKYKGTVLSLHINSYRKNSNIIRTIFTKNRGLVAGVRKIHVN